MKPRVLFISEAVSLAHVARPSVLAAALGAEKFDIHFASSGRFSFCHAGQTYSLHNVSGIAPLEFIERLGMGKPIFSHAELDARVNEDTTLIDSVKPDLIVSDLRLSLGISARRAKIPLLTICNSHWSPFAVRKKMCAPDLPIARLIGHRLFDPIFQWAWPLASRMHVVAANRLRRRYRLVPYTSLREYYCDGDVSMYADSPALVSMRDAPPSHRFIGPILWSPADQLPDWWSEVAQRKDPLVYITLGSTGRMDLLPMIVDACRLERICCMVATAGRSDFQSTSPDVYAEALLPGSKAAALSSLVICNGGSATAYQALSEGRPVLAICSNLDQVMTMQGIVDAGAGEFFRASEATLPRLRAAIQRLRTGESFAQGARALQASFAAFDARERFRQIADEALQCKART